MGIQVQRYGIVIHLWFVFSDGFPRQRATLCCAWTKCPTPRHASWYSHWLYAYFNSIWLIHPLKHHLANDIQWTSPRPVTRWGGSRGLFLAGRHPYQEPSEQHDLGWMNISCPDCGTLHWLVEKLSNSLKHSLKFGMCCMEGKVQLMALEAPPEPLQWLLTSDDHNAKTFRDEI